MGEEAHKAFTFELNECLWFQRGQEVEEVMGISLDPDIAIQEHEDFISVKGAIKLTGEYFQVKKNEREDEDLLTIRDHPSQRLMEHVETYENGVNEFFHTFPVEISIPKYRITALEEVRVGIDSFDYELPENSQLQLHASVVIYGVEDTPELVLQEEEQPVREPVSTVIEAAEPEPEVQAAEEEEPAHKEEEKVFHFDIKAAAEERNEEVEETVEITDEEEIEEPEVVSDTVNDKERWKNKKSQTLAEFFAQKETKPVEADKAPGHNKEEGMEVSNEAVELESESAESDSVSETRYLLNMFQDEEESYSRLKMCIVQETDTLDKLAEKYQVNPLTITKSNRLETDELAEGQILYIPSKS